MNPESVKCNAFNSCYHNLHQYVNRDAAKATPLFSQKAQLHLETAVLLAVVLLILVILIVLLVLVVLIAVLAILIAVLAVVVAAVLIVVLIVIVGHNSFLLLVFGYRSSMSRPFFKYTY